MAAKAGRWLACSLLVVLVIAPMAYAQLEGLDEPEPSRPATASYETLKTDETPAQASVKKPTPKQPARQQPPIKVPKLGLYEAFAGVFLVTYLLNVLWGRARNATIAAAWSKAFTEPGGVFDKNFSSVSAGQSNTLMREAGNCFKFYASGRRHVQGLLATLNLRARQDILSLVWYIVTPTEDTVTLEAYMSEASMPAIVLAVGTPRPLRRLAADQLDVLKYTKKIQAPKESTPGWPNDKLIIQAEHSNIFGEIFSDPRVLQTLNPTGPHAKAFKYFRTLHFTNDAMDGSHKRVLRFTFALPRPGNMQDLAPLMALVPLFIDLVGSYKLSPELKKKAEAARSKTEADTEAETRKQRLDALAQRKQEKLLEEKAKLARLPPAERQKAEDKLRKTQMEKQMKKRTKTM